MLAEPMARVCELFDCGDGPVLFPSLVKRMPPTASAAIASMNPYRDSVTPMGSG